MSDPGSHPSQDDQRWTRLSAKQRACLDLLLEHQTSKQIARRLDISKQAVDLRLTTARNILGAANRAETAIAYARLKATYDRIPCDPVILPPHPAFMPSDFPDGSSAAPLDLQDRPRGETDLQGPRPPFRDLWRYDYRPATRWAIMAAILLLLLIILLAGLAIGQSLTRLLSS